jgi:hypothetical protein
MAKGNGDVKLNWVEIDPSSLNGECQKAYTGMKELYAKAAEFREKMEALFLKHHSDGAAKAYKSLHGAPEGELRLGSNFGKLSFTYDFAKGKSKVSKKAIKL